MKNVKKMTTREAAIYLNISPDNLKVIRPIGPKYQKKGNRIYYLVSDLDKWQNEKIRKIAKQKIQSTIRSLDQKIEAMEEAKKNIFGTDLIFLKLINNSLFDESIKALKDCKNQIQQINKKA